MQSKNLARNLTVDHSAVKYLDGSLVFKDEKVNKLTPNCNRAQRSETFFPEMIKPWKEVQDDMSFEDLVRVVLENQGIYIAAPPGVGKTSLEKTIVRAIREHLLKEAEEALSNHFGKVFWDSRTQKDKDQHIERLVKNSLTITAVTHSASRLAGGDALAHTKHKKRRCKAHSSDISKWIVIDERSQVPLRDWSLISSLKLLGF